MKRGTVVWRRNERLLGQTSVGYARSYWHRLRGLLARPPLLQAEGLVIFPCNAIHTGFMGYPIDVIFISRQHDVVKVASAVSPWRARRSGRARYVVELAAGEAARLTLQVGDQCALE